MSSYVQHSVRLSFSPRLVAGCLIVASALTGCSGTSSGEEAAGDENTRAAGARADTTPGEQGSLAPDGWDVVDTTGYVPIIASLRGITLTSAATTDEEIPTTALLTRAGDADAIRISTPEWVTGTATVAGDTVWVGQGRFTQGVVEGRYGVITADGEFEERVAPGEVYTALGAVGDTVLAATANPDGTFPGAACVTNLLTGENLRCYEAPVVWLAASETKATWLAQTQSDCNVGASWEGGEVTDLDESVCAGYAWVPKSEAGRGLFTSITDDAVNTHRGDSPADEEMDSGSEPVYSAVACDGSMWWVARTGDAHVLRTEGPDDPQDIIAVDTTGGNELGQVICVDGKVAVTFWDGENLASQVWAEPGARLPRPLQ